MTRLSSLGPCARANHRGKYPIAQTPGAVMHANIPLAIVALLSCALLPAAAPAPTPAHPPAATGCLVFAGTADAFRHDKAVQDSQASLDEAIAKWKTDSKITTPVTVTADKPEPHPYWRSTVYPELFLTPDVVTETSYTICWKGVFSPVVCSSGAKVCW